MNCLYLGCLCKENLSKILFLGLEDVYSND